LRRHDAPGTHGLPSVQRLAVVDDHKTNPCNTSSKTASINTACASTVMC